MSTLHLFRKDLQKKMRSELKQMCRDRGLNSTGREKELLIERLLEFESERIASFQQPPIIASTSASSTSSASYLSLSTTPRMPQTQPQQSHQDFQHYQQMVPNSVDFSPSPRSMFDQQRLSYVFSTLPNTVTVEQQQQQQRTENTLSSSQLKRARSPPRESKSSDSGDDSDDESTAPVVAASYKRHKPYPINTRQPSPRIVISTPSNRRGLLIPLPSSFAELHQLCKAAYAHYDHKCGVSLSNRESDSGTGVRIYLKDSGEILALSFRVLRDGDELEVVAADTSANCNCNTKNNTINSSSSNNSGASSTSNSNNNNSNNNNSLKNILSSSLARETRSSGTDGHSVDNNNSNTLSNSNSNSSNSSNDIMAFRQTSSRPHPPPPPLTVLNRPQQHSDKSAFVTVAALTSPKVMEATTFK